MTVAVVAVFAVTWVLIAGRRLHWLPIGRPAGALGGAVAMVAIGALTPEQAYEAIDHDTIALLLGMMLLTAYLERAGAFDALASAALAACRTAWSLLATLSVLAAVLSALLVNDTVCLFLTPVVVATCRRAGLPMGPFLIALATSANIGSAATLVGNPQNMIVGSLSGLPFARFALLAAPAAAVGLCVNLGLLWLYYGRSLPSPVAADVPPSGATGRPAPDERPYLVLAVTAGVVAGFFAGFHLGFTALAGGLVLMLADRQEPQRIFARVDWPLLLFFASLFVVVAALDRTGLVEVAWTAARPWMGLDDAAGLAVFDGIVVLGSNLVSNVPFVLLAGPHVPDLAEGPTAWVLLAFASTVAGNLTIVGSVANVIVAEGARDAYALGFWEYFRFGAVSTVLVLAVGTPVVIGVSWFIH